MLIQLFSLSPMDALLFSKTFVPILPSSDDEAEMRNDDYTSLYRLPC